MIRDRNIDEGTDQAKFTLESVILPINVGASVASVIQSAWRAPYAGKIVSAHVYCATITDADDSVRADLKINGTTALGATVDPVTNDTLTSLAPTTLTFASGDKIQAVILTGAGDAFIGNLVLVVRPLLGHEAL